jgi:hypothetical protein
MADRTKRQVEEENLRLREALEALYDRIAEALSVEAPDADIVRRSVATPRSAGG